MALPVAATPATQYTHIVWVLTYLLWRVHVAVTGAYCTSNRAHITPTYKCTAWQTRDATAWQTRDATAWQTREATAWQTRDATAWQTRELTSWPSRGSPWPAIRYS